MAHPCKLSCLHRFALMYGKSLLVPRGPGQREAAVPLTPVPSLLRSLCRFLRQKHQSSKPIALLGSAETLEMRTKSAKKVCSSNVF